MSKINIIAYFFKGDGVAERSKASVVICTVAILDLGHGRHLSSTKSRCLKREGAIPHPEHGRKLWVPK